MKVIVIEAHVSSYPNPIRFNEGDALILGVRDTEFPGWIRTTTKDGNEGWAPEQYIQVNEDDSRQGRAACDYSAFELTTVVGEALLVKRELNDWYWVENTSGAEGWVPVQTTDKVV